MDAAILSIIPERDPDLITYVSELLKTNIPKQRNNTFLFPTPENPGNIEDHTPKQTRILKESHDLKVKEKVNPKDNVESQLKIVERLEKTNTLLTETEKQTVEDILVE